MAGREHVLTGRPRPVMPWTGPAGSAVTRPRSCTRRLDRASCSAFASPAPARGIRLRPGPPRLAIQRPWLPRHRDRGLPRTSSGSPHATSGRTTPATVRHRQAPGQRPHSEMPQICWQTDARNCTRPCHSNRATTQVSNLPVAQIRWHRTAGTAVACANSRRSIRGSISCGWPPRKYRTGRSGCCATSGIRLETDGLRAASNRA